MGDRTNPGKHNIEVRCPRCGAEPMKSCVENGEEMGFQVHAERSAGRLTPSPFPLVFGLDERTELAWIRGAVGAQRDETTYDAVKRNQVAIANAARRERTPSAMDRDLARARAFLIWMEGEEMYFCPGDLRPDCAQLNPAVVPRLAAEFRVAWELGFSDGGDAMREENRRLRAELRMGHGQTSDLPRVGERVRVHPERGPDWARGKMATVLAVQSEVRLDVDGGDETDREDWWDLDRIVRPLSVNESVRLAELAMEQPTEQAPPCDHDIDLIEARSIVPRDGAVYTICPSCAMVLQTERFVGKSPRAPNDQKSPSITEITNGSEAMTARATSPSIAQPSSEELLCVACGEAGPERETHPVCQGCLQVFGDRRKI